MITRPIRGMHAGWRIGTIMVAFLFLAGCASPRAVNERGGSAVTPVAYPVVPQHLFAPDYLASLDDYLERAFAYNPGLQAALHRVRAAEQRVPMARAWDDPNLSFEYFLDANDTRYRVSLTQRWPPFGTRRIRNNRAEAEARATWHVYEAERSALAEEVVRAFHEYRYLYERIRLTDKTLALLTEIEQSAEGLYRAGSVPFSDLIHAQIERARLEDRLASLHARRRAQSVSIAALLNLPPEPLLPWPEPASADTATGKDFPDLERLADLNPELHAAAARVRAAGYGEDLARRNRLPQLMLGAGFMVMQGMDGGRDESDVGVMAGLSLPLQRRRMRAERRESAAQRAAAEQELEHREIRLRAELSEAVFRFEDAARQWNLFQDALIPKAEQARAVAEREYAEGTTNLSAFLDAQRTLLNFRLLAARAAADRAIALGTIRRHSGAYGAGRAGPEIDFDLEKEDSS